jgi:hypothetical protein
VKAVPFEQIEKPKRAGDGVWLCGYGYSKIERDKVEIQARPQTTHFGIKKCFVVLLVEKDFLPRTSTVHYMIDGWDTEYEAAAP